MTACAHLSADSSGRFLRRMLLRSSALGVLVAAGLAAVDLFLSAAYLAYLGWALCGWALWRWIAREMLGRRRAWVLLTAGACKALWVAALLALSVFLGLGERPGVFPVFLLGANTPFLILSVGALRGIVADRRERRGISRA